MRRSSYLLALWLLCLSLATSPLFGQASVSVDTRPLDMLNEVEEEENLEALSATFGLSNDGQLVYGAQLFQGEFRDISFSGFNPAYQISVGDEIQLMIWGAVHQQLKLRVDPQGNIFIPEVGPVRVQGVRNEDLNDVIRNHVKRVFSQNVEVYANLLSAQNVKVFVSGYAKRPGLYEGYASDSILFFLDKAQGIDLDRGSFIDIKIKRQGEAIKEINLYDFLSTGEMDLTQFRDGDSIFVGPIRHTVSVKGQVSNPGRFEFTGDSVPLSYLVRLATPDAISTHVSIQRKTRGKSEAFFFPIEEAQDFPVLPDDAVNFTTTVKPSSILVTITGEHLGDDHQVLTYGSLLADSLARIRPSPRSDMNSVQLFRESVAERQKQLLNQMLDNLERTALNARSDSLEEAKLRLSESEMILKFVERGRNIQPKGQVLLDNPRAAEEVYLEDGDVIYIPSTSMLVTVYGEVKFPNTQLFNADYDLRDYITKAGGFTDNANKDEIILIRRNGLVENVGKGRWIEPLPGDEIFVLPKPDSKNLQMAKDISTILYQIAIAARVVIGL